MQCTSSPPGEQEGDPASTSHECTLFSRESSSVGFAGEMSLVEKITPILSLLFLKKKKEKKVPRTFRAAAAVRGCIPQDCICDEDA